MYARVDLFSPRTDAPLLIPSDALIARGQGTEVAVVRPDRRVHLQKIEVGRDYGDRLEVLPGLHAGDRIIANPDDNAREGVKVEAVEAVEKPSRPRAAGAGKVAAPPKNFNSLSIRRR